MKKVIVIGGGISGLSIANLLKKKYQVKVLEKFSHPGGLIRCERIEGNLYHMVGGHVFNSKRQDVLDWFWSFFIKDIEFTSSKRNAVVFLEKVINYPIENHLYQFDDELMDKIISELLIIEKKGYPEPTNFEDFLKNRFGETLYEIYFKPYNEKIWKRDLSNVSLSWLEGKLPMPSVREIIHNNFRKEDEKNMVHSSFYYPKNNGSQYLADRFAEGLDIDYNIEFRSLVKKGNKLLVNGSYECDLLVYTGNIKEIPNIVAETFNIKDFYSDIDTLQYHGTTTVLCEIESNPYSWVYLPNKSILPHRIICTGNFSASNNSDGIKTATIEFTDYVEKESILKNLQLLPFSPRYISHRYTKYTYPIQDKNTRVVINKLKEKLETENIFLLGRFAEWEYYNMDAAMGAAIDLDKRIEDK